MDIVAREDDHAHVQVKVRKDELIQLEAILRADITHLTVDVQDHFLPEQFTYINVASLYGNRACRQINGDCAGFHSGGFDLLPFFIDVHLRGLKAMNAVLGAQR